MNWLTGFAVYFVIWWITLFMVLPLNIQPHQDKTPGLDPGAPQNPQLGKKILINTVLALVIFGIFYAIHQSGWISFRERALG